MNFVHDVLSLDVNDQCATFFGIMPIFLDAFFYGSLPNSSPNVNACFCGNKVCSVLLQTKNGNVLVYFDNYGSIVYY